MTDFSSKSDLAEALRDVIDPSDPTPAQREAAERQATRARRQRNLTAVAVLGWIVLVGIWVLRPAFIFDPEIGVASEVTLRGEASLRYALYLQASRIRDYVEEHSRVPETLEATGDVEEGISYERRAIGWILTGREGNLTLQLTDQMSVDSFLGNSIRNIRRPNAGPQ